MQQLLKTFKTQFLLFLIIILAMALRGYRLGEVPHGITWDEAAIGYNGYAIITTRRDEWLQRLPVSFKSFGDYKAPLAIYISGIFTTLLHLGLTPWGIRVPFFLSGVLAVIGMYFLTEVMLERLGQKNAEQRKNLALISSFLLAVSPWHLHFSRTGFESGLALTLLIWGALGWFKAVTTKKQLWWWASAACFAASLYAYHSSKVVVPLILLSLLLADFKTLWQQRMKLILPALLALGLLWPLVQDALWGHGLERAGTLIFSQRLSPAEFWLTLSTNVRTQLGFDFWFRGATNTLRHGDGRNGVLYGWDLLVLLSGGWFLLKTSLKKVRTPEYLLAVWGLIWTLFGLAPAILGTEVPHPNRALLGLVGVIWLITACWSFITAPAKQSQQLTLNSVLVFGYLVSLVSYQWYYYSVFPKTGSAAFFDGYYMAAVRTVQLEKQNPTTTPINKILFTSDYAQPYIFILLARRTNPIWYQGGSLSQYEFSDKITIGDLNRANTLVIASAEDELPNAKPDEVITDVAGVTKFKIFYPHPSYE